MRRIVFLVLLSIMAGQAFSQRQYFIYIGTHPAQPFYVRTGNKTYSSTGAGTLILSQLKDSTYKLNLGFPGNRYPEHEFDITVNGHDLGFELKNIDKGWVLYNWVSGSTIMPLKKQSFSSGGTGVPRSDPFALLMAGVVNDSLVLYNQVLRKEPPPEVIAKKDVEGKDTSVRSDTSVFKEAVASEGIISSLQQDSANKRDLGKNGQDSVAVAVTNKATDLQNEAKKEMVLSDSSGQVTGNPDIPKTEKAYSGDSLVAKKPVGNTNKPSEAAVILLSDSMAVNGHLLVFKDKSDTISLLIPSQSEAIVANTGLAISDSARVADNGRAENRANPVAGNINSPEKEADQPTEQGTTHLKMINSDCREYATEQDLDKLRVQMLKETGAGERIAVAKKYFRSKCYTTKQIRALSELFPADEGRYRFFDAAYPFVSDSGNFKTLVELFSEPFYISRFNFLVHG